MKFSVFQTSFSVTHVGTDVISAGGKGKAEITIETIPESLQSFLINLVTCEPNGTESKLILLSCMCFFFFIHSLIHSFSQSFLNSAITTCKYLIQIKT